MMAPRVFLALMMIILATPALAAKRPMASGERIDVNRASAAQLMRLPGIGKKRAQAIVTYRARQPFRRLEDLLLVNGISARWLQRVKEHLTVTETSSLPSTKAGSDLVK